MMIFNIKKFRIARLLIVLFIFGTYSWLVIWTTKKITIYAERRSKSNQYHDVDIYEEAITRKIVIFDEEKYIKFSLNQTANNDCQKQLPITTKRWFYARFDPKIDTSWNIENSYLNHDIYEWWLNLQNSKGVNTELTLQKLYDIGVGRNDESGTKKCKKCAVVGNSGNLLHSRYGEVIDDHDFVMRMNTAPVSGFEDDVGSITTHRFMYPESALKSIPQEVRFVLIPFKPVDMKWLLSALTTGEIQKTYAPVPEKISCNKSRIDIVNPNFIRYVHNRWLNQNGRYPSTGFLAVIYALHQCSEVNLYGFGADETGNWHHYWEDLPKNIAGAFKSTGVHDSEWERTILDQLDAKSIIRINIKKTI